MLDDREWTARVPDDDGAHRPPLVRERRPHGNREPVQTRVVADAVRTMPSPGGPFVRLGAARAMR